MTEKVANKKTLFATYINTGMLIFIIGIIMNNYANIKDAEYKTFDTTAQKAKIIRHTENTTFSEVEASDLVHHAKDSIAHMTRLERKAYTNRMARYDSVMKVFLEEQWSQGQRLRRIEKKINKLNN